jgi:hypothetical protein
MMRRVRVCVLDSDGSELANADRRNDWKAIAEFADRFGRPVQAARHRKLL